jgi:5'-3' exonuclease
VTYVLLLDTSSMMYRAFFSVPTSVRSEDGSPINAMHGYLDMTAVLTGTYRPDAVIHVFDDDWRPAPRVTVYDGYKAQRPPDPEGLPEQFEVLKDVLLALGHERADAPGWEAEDAIGTIAARGAAADRFDIVTGDRDLLQLVHDPNVRVLFTLKGVSRLHEFDEAAVQEKYGVPADRYAEFAMLRGDASDGLPGVRGVGEKTARALMQAYGSLDEVMAQARAARRRPGPLQGAGRLVANLRDTEGYLDAMRQIVPIRTDLEVRRIPGRHDPDRLAALGERYRLGGPIRRLQAAEAGEASDSGGS